MNDRLRRLLTKRWGSASTGLGHTAVSGGDGDACKYEYEGDGVVHHHGARELSVFLKVDQTARHVVDDKTGLKNGDQRQRLKFLEAILEDDNAAYCNDDSSNNDGPKLQIPPVHHALGVCAEKHTHGLGQELVARD